MTISFDMPHDVLLAVRQHLIESGFVCVEWRMAGQLLMLITNCYYPMPGASHDCREPYVPSIYVGLAGGDLVISAEHVQSDSIPVCDPDALDAVLRSALEIMRQMVQPPMQKQRTTILLHGTDYWNIQFAAAYNAP